MMNDVLEVLRGHSRFVVTTHVRPDGDAIGSQLAMGLFLESLGKDVRLINEHPVPVNLSWMPSVERVWQFDGSLGHHQAFAAADAIIVVDCNAISRLGKNVAGPVRNSNALKILIDHHTEPETWFDYAIKRERAAATGELVFELIGQHDPALVRGAVATAIYVALLTDTGSFRFDTVTPAVHRIVADLLERGAAPPAEVYGAVYENKTTCWARLLGQALGTLTLHHGGRLAYICVSRRMVADAGADYEDTENFVDYALAVERVDVALLFLETPSGTKISFRSKGRWPVHRWAKSFGGGGHRNAAGAYVTRPLNDVVNEVISSSHRYVDFLAANGTVVPSTEDEEYLSALMEGGTL